MDRPYRKVTGWGFGLTLFFVSGLGSALGHADTQVFGRFEASVVSEPEAVRSSFRDWGSEFKKGERQWAVALAELGMRYRGFELSVQRRAQLDLRINKEAAEFYGRIERKEELEPGTSVPLELRVETFSAEALRAGYRLQGKNWQLTTGVAYLRAEQLITGDVQGQLVAISGKDFDLDASVDYAYYKDSIFKRELDSEPKGEGWAVDLAGHWQLNEHWQVSGRVDDLYGRIRWKDLPYTRARAHTDRKVYDEDGFAVFKPLASGREGYHSHFTQELRPRYQAQLQYSTGNWRTSLHGLHQFGYSLAGIGAGYQIKDDVQLHLTWWPELDALSLQWRSKQWQAQLALDSFNSNRAHSMSLTVSYGF